LARADLSHGFGGGSRSIVARSSGRSVSRRGGPCCGRPLSLVCIDSGNQSSAALTAAAQRPVGEHGVHAIINGYNMGSMNAEYEVVADAGLIYIHNNTLIQHRDTVASDPERDYGCFMGNPADYWSTRISMPATWRIFTSSSSKTRSAAWSTCNTAGCIAASSTSPANWPRA
jgi:hypothetical protein